MQRRGARGGRKGSARANHRVPRGIASLRERIRQSSEHGGGDSSADMGGAKPVPAQMWQGEPGPGNAEGVSPVPVMREGGCGVV
jgi:hypothetical protein